MDQKKKQAAAIAAVTLYLKAEQEALAQQAMVAAMVNQRATGPAAAPIKVWGISGRQAQMQMRSMMQMKTFKS